MSGAWQQTLTQAARLDPAEVRLAGYAAVFGKADAAGDIIEPNAFDRTLRDRQYPLPLFWQHQPEKQIGWVTLAEPDSIGLRIIATVTNPHSRAADLLRRKTVSGLSFGYRARRFSALPDGRKLTDIELLEVSVVTHPLQHEARIHLLN